MDFIKKIYPSLGNLIKNIIKINLALVFISSQTQLLLIYVPHLGRRKEFTLPLLTFSVPQAGMQQSKTNDWFLKFIYLHHKKRRYLVYIKTMLSKNWPIQSSPPFYMKSVSNVTISIGIMQLLLLLFLCYQFDRTSVNVNNRNIKIFYSSTVILARNLIYIDNYINYLKNYKLGLDLETFNYYRPMWDDCMYKKN